MCKAVKLSVPYAVVTAVKRTEQYGHVIFLRLVDDLCNSLLPVYIGAASPHRPVGLHGRTLPLSLLLHTSQDANVYGVLL